MLEVLSSKSPCIMWIIKLPTKLCIPRQICPTGMCGTTTSICTSATGASTVSLNAWLRKHGGAESPNMKHRPLAIFYGATKKCLDTQKQHHWRQKNAEERV